MLQISVRFSVLLIVAAALAPAAPGYAQQSLSEVLEAIQNDRPAMGPEDSTQKPFRFDFENSRKTLDEAREELAAVEARIEALRSESERLKVLRREIYQKLDEKAAVLVRGAERPERD